MRQSQDVSVCQSGVMVAVMMHHCALLCFSHHEAELLQCCPGPSLVAALLSHKQHLWPKGELYLFIYVFLACHAFLINHVVKTLVTECRGQVQNPHIGKTERQKTGCTAAC